MEFYFSFMEYIRNLKFFFYIDGKVRKKEKREEFEIKLREVVMIVCRLLFVFFKC